MKKNRFQLLIFLIFFPSLFALSQNLPNYDLEDWASDGTFVNPLNWGTSNYSVFSVVSFNTVTKENIDTYSGNSCAKLQTIEKLVGSDIVKVAGLITLGSFDVNLATRKAIVKGGIPFFAKPTIFSGYYKYTSPGIDSCLMSIYFTKFNNNTKKSDTLGLGIFTSGETSEWNRFEIPILYNSLENPDSMNIIILSSDTSLLVDGSTLLVDKLYIDATTSDYPSILPQKKYRLYPNPSDDYLRIETFDTNLQIEYSIINISGISLKHDILNSKNDNIDISMFISGTYFIELVIDHVKYSEPFIIK